MKLKKEEKSRIIVQEKDFAEKCGFNIVFSAEKGLCLSTVSISRPGFMLSGYGDYFASSRVQVFGKSEMSYLDTLTPEFRKKRLSEFFGKRFPCLIVSRGQKIPDDIKTTAAKFGVSLFSSTKITADVINDLTAYLNELLAPISSLHGVLIDVFGTGVLLIGESGIGKSETALELVHRGHRLVSDDLVDLKLVKDRLFGSSPAITRYMMEIRGIGIVDVEAIYGVGAVLNRKRVELVIELERWNQNKEYDRIGNCNLSEPILGISLPKYLIPVIPGRNLAIIIEVAVRNFRLKQEGYDALQELTKRSSQTEDK